ncbi:MAG TPA: hypothetical protein VGY98_00330 [Verrucomicrobiae bacterium]|nr:hypothetical protein [Verrucomicrobiae bacterium]
MLASIIAGVIVVSGVLIWTFVPQRQRRKRFDARPDLDLDQIYNAFFSSKSLPKELVCELWKEVSGTLHVPSGKLRPTDRFDDELAAPKGWEYDDEIMDVHWAAERRLKRIGGQSDLSQVKTVGDYVEFFCKLQAQPPEG